MTGMRQASSNVAIHGDARAVLVEGRRRSDLASLGVYASHTAIVFAPVYLSAWAGIGWHLIPCWIWFGVSAHGLLLLLHECIHKLALQNVRWNEGLAHLLSPLFFTEFDSFRRRHWAHHRALGTAEDPKYTYRVDVRGRAFLGLILRSLFLSEGAAKMKLQASTRSGSSYPLRALFWIGLVQMVFCVTIFSAAWWGKNGDAPMSAALSAATTYLFVYVYGMASLTPLVHTLRGVAEHKPCDPGEVVIGDAALRNFTPGLVERCVWGAYGFVDHATHHRYPAVPAYLLPAVTREEVNHDQTLMPAGTHTQVLVRMIRGQLVD